MKSAKTMTIAMAMLFIGMIAVQGAPEEKGTPGKNELQVICSPKLEVLANQLVSDYTNMNEETQIRVIVAKNREVYGNLQEGTVALVNKDGFAGMEGKQYFKVVVGRDVLVPIMNARHPQRDLILNEGISPYDFSVIFTSREKITWGEVLGLSDQHPVHAYVPDESCSLDYLAEFMHTDPGELAGLVRLEPEEMMKKIAGDPGAIGFCSLSCLMKMESNGLDTGIELVPVDMDGDGQIGSFEEIYESSSMLSHAIFVGRFPKDLYSRIFAVTIEQPAGTTEIAFMEWLISGGQETLASAGILELGYGERNSRMEQLLGHEQAIASVPVKASPARVYLVVAGFLLLLGFLIYAWASITGRRKMAPLVSFPQGEGSAVFPGGLFFDRSHTWTFMEKSGWVRIGIDDFLQHVCGSVTRVAMKQPGEKIKRGDTFLTMIQNGKRLEIKSPVSGIIQEQNKALIHDASLLNSQPYADGWVLMVEPQRWITELKSYFMGQAYTDWLKSEMARLKEFLASTMNIQDEAKLVLQDGGELRESVLELLGPEVWEEFQEGFINNAK
jgi:glycine cleavage system H lipoate-binding protein/ABC-type phosphate transport system substrate-binding protein